MADMDLSPRLDVLAPLVDNLVRYALRHAADGLTVTQLADITGEARHVVRAALVRLADAGVAEQPAAATSTSGTWHYIAGP